MMRDDWQDEDLIKADIERQARLETERMPWEATWREVDERFPDGAGGFTSTTPGQIRGSRNYDSTHITALERFAAAGVAITTPEEDDYIRPYFADEYLMRQRSVQLWCNYAGKRLKAIRHAIHTGFNTASNEDWDQLGRYGTSPLWQDATEQRGMMYRCLHLSETWIDVDHAGLTDTVHRKFKRTARQLAEFFGMESLTPKMLDNLKEKQGIGEFEILHVVVPNTVWDKDKWDYRRFPISSRYIALEEKLYIRRAGYHTMPISVSRHMTSAGEKYGRSPAIKVMPNIQGVNAMKLTGLRAVNKAVDPALMFFDDDGITKLVTKPGGLNPGLVDEMGRPKVSRMPGGEAGIPYTIEFIQDDREAIKSAFLEDFYKILTDPNSRMTTTEVLEVMSKQGVLVRPYASRYATEKQHPMTQRDLDLALRAGQIDDMPPEVKEAGAWPVIHYENPLATMARAERTGKTLRFMEVLQPFAAIDPTVYDYIDLDELIPGVADEIGIDPKYVRSREDVAAKRGARDDQAAAATTIEGLQGAASAYLDTAKANQISQAA